MKKIACLILLCLIAVQLSAQSPSAIFVMLKSQRNKIEYFNSIAQQGKAKEVADAAQIVMTKTIADFTNRFSHCPVYYFIDTNLELIKQKKFDNVLFNDKHQLYEVPPAKPSDSSILIVYYGIPPIELVTEGHLSKEKKNYRNPGYLGNGLVVLGHDFQKIERTKLYYAYRYESWVPRGVETDYTYTSDKYNIAYIPIARKLDYMLTRFGMGRAKK